MAMSGAAVLEISELEPSSPVEASLIQLLEAQALSDQISGAELARRIGVDHAHWSRVRRGLGDRFGVVTCAKVVVTYPHLKDAAARYLAGSYDPDGLKWFQAAGRLAHAARLLAAQREHP